MQLIEVSAKTGYVWFRQGIWLFRRNPLAFVTLFFTYLLAMMLVSLVPVIGAALPLLLIPGIAVGFMAACRDTIAGKQVLPTILIDGFRSYGPTVTQRLLALGGLYIVSMAAVFACSALGDGGTLLKIMFGLGAENLGPEALDSPGVRIAVLIAAALYAPVAMMFWFAPVLTAWHDVPPVKALFFSVVSCWRNKGAFTVYGLLWFALARRVVRARRADAGARRQRLRAHGDDAGLDRHHRDALLLLLCNLSRLLRRAGAGGAESAERIRPLNVPAAGRRLACPGLSRRPSHGSERPMEPRRMF